MTFRTSTSSGFTLIEVLISLSLMTVILTLIVMALDISLRQMSLNRTEVEEAQLARAVLEIIARDIRNVVPPLREEQLEVDTEALSSLFGVSYELDESIAFAGTEDATATVSGEIFGVLPGIYGDAEWLQVDTARLPRGEMYGSRQVRSGGSVLADRLSPSKTVLYYLGEETGQIAGTDDPRYRPDRLTGSLGRSLDTTALRYGLFRRQLDRLVTQYAVNEGLETEYEQYDEPLAPEVEWIEFAYFDLEAGQESSTGDWVESWDMDERQALPRAVRITVAIRRQSFSRSMLTPWTTSDAVPTIVYSLIVPLPLTIEPIPEEDAEATTE